MARGYAEGPAIEDRLAALEQPVRAPAAATRQAVYGATADNPAKHFLGWLGEVDPDKLFDSGQASGLSIVRRAA